MNIKPKFSIITVTYNAEKVLKPTLDSVASQTYRNIEYLLVDGASTDGTVELARQYGTLISQLVSEPDKGLYHAMNKGIKLSTGDYLCFLNAGDSFHSPTVLQEIVESIENEPALPDVLYGETAEVDENRNFMRMRRLKAPERLNSKSFKKGMLVCHQAFIARRTLAPMYDVRYKYSSDVDWCIEVMKSSRKLVNVNIVIVDYLQNGLSLQNHRASLLERYSIMSKHYGRFSTLLNHLWFAIRAIIKR